MSAKRNQKGPFPENAFSVPRNTKRHFASNDAAWLATLDYFSRFLPILLRSLDKKPCVIFDIDFTVLHYSSPLNTKELRLSSPQALKLYELFRTSNVPIYFVTARPYSRLTVDVTQKELATLGFKDYVQIYYMPSISDDIGYYKQTMRDILRSQFQILFNVGDQWTDLCNRPIMNEEKYNAEAFLMYGVEPGCDWALKLISHQNRASSLASLKPYLDSIFDTVRDAFITGPPRQPEVPCRNCGLVHPVQ